MPRCAYFPTTTVTLLYRFVLLQCNVCSILQSHHPSYNTCNTIPPSVSLNLSISCSVLTLLKPSHRIYVHPPNLSHNNYHQCHTLPRFFTFLPNASTTFSPVVKLGESTYPIHLIIFLFNSLKYRSHAPLRTESINQNSSKICPFVLVASTVCDQKHKVLLNYSPQAQLNLKLHSP